MMKRAIIGLFVCTVLAGASSPTAATGRPERKPDDGPPKVGEAAPLFALKTVDGKGEFDLKSSFAKRPVVLIFGSYT